MRIGAGGWGGMVKVVWRVEGVVENWESVGGGMKTRLRICWRVWGGHIGMALLIREERCKEKRDGGDGVGLQNQHRLLPLFPPLHA